MIKSNLCLTIVLKIMHFNLISYFEKNFTNLYDIIYHFYKKLLSSSSTGCCYYIWKVYAVISQIKKASIHA